MTVDREPIKAHFFIRYKEGKFAFRSMVACPRIGDFVVFDEVRYLVAKVEWCLDHDASNVGGNRVNIEIERTSP